MVNFKEFPFFEAFCHIKNNVYPCWRRFFCLFFYGIFALFWISIPFIMGFQINYICLALFFVMITWGICIKVSGIYGINCIGKINLAKYIDYVISNYWCNIEKDTNRSCLEYALMNAKSVQGNFFQETIDNSLQKVNELWRKKYLIKAIISVCDETCVEQIMKSLVAQLTLDNNSHINEFIIEQIHIWNINNRAIDNLKIYFQMLEKISGDEQLEKKTIRNLVDYVINSEELLNEMSCLQTMPISDFIKQRHAIRMEQYLKAEAEIVKKIKTAKKTQGTYVDFKQDSLQDMPQ